MTTTDFVKVENFLSRLLASVEQVFNREELDEVQGFFDAGEYGLALETFADIIVDEGKKITRSDLDSIKNLATLMAMDQEVFHQKLEGFLE